MQFGWLNLTGFMIVAMMMIPNIIYALRNRHMVNKCTSRPMLILEQVGRYGSMTLMVFPLLVWEFGFASVGAFILWGTMSVTMLLAYFICWGFYFRKPSLPVSLWLAILPSAIFILRGVFLRHWLLTAFGIIFAVGHIYITWFNHNPDAESK